MLFRQIIPLRQSDVDMTVSNFRVLPDELRRNIPDLLLACMSAIFAQYKKAKVGKASTAATSASVAHDRRQGEYRGAQNDAAAVRGSNSARHYCKVLLNLSYIQGDPSGGEIGLG